MSTPQNPIHSTTVRPENATILNSLSSNNSAETSSPDDVTNSTSSIHNPPNSEGEPDSSCADTTTKQRGKRKYTFQRASVACEQCRKAKTRCNYIDNGANCFRCENLSLKCSLSDLKHEPILSTFQQSADLKIRDVTFETSPWTRRKKIKPLSNVQSLPIMTGPNLNNTNTSIGETENRNGNENDNETSGIHSISNSSTDPILRNDASKSPQSTDLLSIIDEKLDSLTSTLNKLVNERKGVLAPKDNNTNSFPKIYNTQRTDPANSLPKLYSAHPLPSTFPLMAPPPPLPPTTATTITQQPPITTAFLPSTRPPPTHASLLPPPISAPLARPYLHPPTKLLSNEYQLLPATFANSNGKLLNQSAVHENDEFFFLNAPYIDVLNLSSTVGLPFSKEIGFDITKDAILVTIQERYDLINRRLVDYDTCFELIEIALTHYGKWISYVGTDYKSWFETVRISSPLLFSTLVLLGLRHHKCSNITESLELDILQSIHQLLSLSIYEVPQSKEVLQTIILLTHFSPSLSYKHIYFDSWWLSSYGLIHFMTREMSINLLVKGVKSPEKIHQYRIWNHLTLSHLINCILSGRPCIIDEIRLDQCRDILDLPETNSFDAIVVAELCIILSLYNSLQFREDLETSMKELDTVYSDWKYLSNSSALGSVIVGFYYFAKMMILRRYILKNLSQRGQSNFNKICGEFFSYSISVSNFIKLRTDIFDYSDCIKQSLFLCLFMTLQFKQLGLFNEPDDNSIILTFVDNYLEISTLLENKEFFYNGYYSHYSELILRLRNMVFPNTQFQSTQQQ